MPVCINLHFNEVNKILFKYSQTKKAKKDNYKKIQHINDYFIVLFSKNYYINKL